ncbi:biopolymer transporter ExbD [Parvibaculum sp.]|jgi:biopolymer transport protein ExbD|uniref:ExbD/TolR family protein n=1 Tax=Parvibaculum sp. TaxID=2024848 RepID=UPI000C3D3E5E|nr:biopolymer transporter ExbD [Parvibaculum sp.]MAM95256.1 biopolymer transporter ExbD [Parvibaculum sp.]HCX69106.1 biopolymer transporter ExbD [Rhodobiaceae bacterium]|tara:strand:+ start:8415 stop:8840 length:426 start_codon:yes stop_codon:yes gene_type:complete
MAMNVGSGGDEDEPMMEINTTPLIDVMLVLLVMLIITIPLQTHAIKLDMPQAVATEINDEPSIVQLVVDEYGLVSWNGEELPDMAALESKFAGAADATIQPEIHLRPNRMVEYDHVAKVLAAAQRLGVTKIGFVGNEQYID